MTDWANQTSPAWCHACCCACRHCCRSRYCFILILPSDYGCWPVNVCVPVTSGLCCHIEWIHYPCAGVGLVAGRLPHEDSRLLLPVYLDTDSSPNSRVMWETGIGCTLDDGPCLRWSGTYNSCDCVGSSIAYVIYADSTTGNIMKHIWSLVSPASCNGCLHWSYEVDLHVTAVPMTRIIELS